MNCSSLVRRALGASLFTFFFLGATGLAQAEIAARTDFVHGLVTANVSGQAQRTLEKGADIFDRDQIDTAQGARAQLRFSDGGLVSLLPNTVFSVEEYRLGDAGGEDGSLVFGLLQGGLRTVTGAIGKTQHDNYQLKTPVGTLGIRGTEFIAIIDPPGMLRVHVGRGKVVLTNQHSTLEVPEGFNAIMMLDEAPRLTEEGPVFMATGPQGDLQVPVGMVRADPYYLDLPLAVALPPEGTPPPPPGGGTDGVLPGGPGYAMAVMLEEYYNFSMQSPLLVSSGDAVFDPNTGALISFDDPNGVTLDAGGADVSGQTTAGLNWGILTDGNVGLWGGSISYPIQSTSIVPYITGEVETAPSGTLSFSLPAGVTPSTYSNPGASVGTLTQFDLNINLGGVAAATYDLDMALTTSISPYVVDVTGAPLSFSGGIFDFSIGTTASNGIVGACPSDGCALDVRGFVTTSGGAGIAYELEANDEYVSGVAPLVPNPPNSIIGG